MKPVGRALKEWLAGSLGSLAVAIAVGYLPTLRLGGAAATGALWGGCAVGLAGAMAGAAPVLLALAAGGSNRPHVTAGWAMALRSAVTLVGALAVALGSALPKTALLAWVGITYLTLLVVETRWTLRWLVTGATK